MEKKKVSQFEFAITEALSPNEAKDIQPRTNKEELELREGKLLKQAKRLKIINYKCENNKKLIPKEDNQPYDYYCEICGDQL